jgi:hypothetical protein
LTPLLGEGPARVLSIALFLIPLVGFLAVGAGILGWIDARAWWRTVAIVSAVISLITMLLYWNAFVLFFPNKVGALAVNVAVLVGLLVANWPAAAELGL